MKKPENWEIVRDKLLGIDLYDPNLTFEMLHMHLMNHFQKTSEIKEIVYVSKEAFQSLYVNTIKPIGHNAISYYWYMGVVRVFPI